MNNGLLLQIARIILGRELWDSWHKQGRHTERGFYMDDVWYDGPAEEIEEAITRARFVLDVIRPLIAPPIVRTKPIGPELTAQPEKEACNG